MPTTATPKTTKTAAELYAEAEAAAAAERDLADRRRAATKAAQIVAVRDVLDDPADQVSAASQAARQAWDAATGDEHIGHDQLFTLWLNMRQTSGVRAAHVAQASAVWDQLEPRDHGRTSHRADVHDYMDPRGELTWALALEAVIQKRVDNAKATTRANVQQGISQAGIDAAAAIK